MHNFKFCQDKYSQIIYMKDSKDHKLGVELPKARSLRNSPFAGGTYSERKTLGPTGNRHNWMEAQQGRVRRSAEGSPINAVYQGGAGRKPRAVLMMRL